MNKPFPGEHRYARKICHGRNVQLYHRYQRGVLGLVLNCVVLWNTVYLDVHGASYSFALLPVLAASCATPTRPTTKTTRDLPRGPQRTVLKTVLTGTARRCRLPRA